MTKLTIVQVFDAFVNSLGGPRANCYIFGGFLRDLVQKIRWHTSEFDSTIEIPMWALPDILSDIDFCMTPKQQVVFLKMLRLMMGDSFDIKHVNTFQESNNQENDDDPVAGAKSAFGDKKTISLCNSHYLHVEQYIISSKSTFLPKAGVKIDIVLKRPSGNNTLFFVNSLRYHGNNDAEVTTKNDLTNVAFRVAFGCILFGSGFNNTPTTYEMERFEHQLLTRKVIITLKPKSEFGVTDSKNAKYKKYLRVSMNRASKLAKKGYLVRTPFLRDGQYTWCCNVKVCDLVEFFENITFSDVVRSYDTWECLFCKKMY